MPARRVLILAGTGEARALAQELHERGIATVCSLVGVTKTPALPHGEIRTGGFGGSEGLKAYLREAAISHVVDATHPFAAQISTHAHTAAHDLALPLLRLERAPWPHDDTWWIVRDIEEAARILPAQARVMLTTGHRGLASFFDRADLSGVVRTIEQPAQAMPKQWHLLLQRPPYEFPDEVTLFKQNVISHLVTKNSGGDATTAKLDAARACGVAVIMIERPVKPACATVSRVDQALEWLGI